MARKTQAIPTPAWVLGIAGLIPFITSALLACLPDVGSTLLRDLARSADAEAMSTSALQQQALLALGAYGAIILSFLGGIRWGNLLNSNPQLHQWPPFLLSVLPSLIAWPAVLLSPSWMLGVLAVGFIWQYAYDMKGVKKNILPTWFGKLRTILTIGATVSLLAGLIATVL